MKWSFDTQEEVRFSRHWWLRSARNLVWVVLVTVLIWIYADLEFTRKEDLSATIELTTGGKYALLSSTMVDVTFKVAGSSASVEAFQKRLGALRCDVSAYGPRDYPVEAPTTDILQRAVSFSQAGLELLSAVPGTISLRIDEFRTEELEVRLDSSGAVVTEETITPKKVKVRVARSQWEEILQQNPAPFLKTQPVKLQEIESGRPFPVEIEPLVGGIRVEPHPKTVEVKVTVSELTDTRSFAVSVGLQFPPTWAEDATWAQYSLERKDKLEWRPQITVRGPKKDIEALTPEKVEAYVDLTEEDKNPTGTWWKKEVVVRFPRDRKVELVGSAPTVEYKLVRRSAPPPP